MALRWLAVAFGGVAGAGWTAWEILRRPWVREWLAQSKTLPLDLLTLVVLLAADAVPPVRKSGCGRDGKTRGWLRR